MKQTEISKVRGWWKHLLLLCVTLLGVASFASAQNYPFPQNYEYPYGEIYTGSNVQSKIQSLYEAWKSNYYTKSGDLSRVKFVQEGEDGTNSVSEGIAYGMLIFVYMDNSKNNTQSDFDGLWRYYKKNSNNNGVMNWKVNGFTGQVTAGAGNANGATDADLDAAQALLLAHKQWGSTGSINYLEEAKTLINNIWTYEVNNAKQLKPGDMFDDYKNPCYFITNAMQLFAYVEKKQGWTQHQWTTVISNCYTLMKKAANSTTGLIPDWCYENGSYLSGLINSKFESIFGYDAVRIPWRMAHAYAWYGHKDAYDIADKITTWCKGKYSNPDDIVDGYQLNGTPGTGGLGGSLKSWGTGKNACFKGGLSLGSMVDSKHSNYMDLCWSVGSATDQWGKYYTHTTQLLFMLCLTGNMPNFWDMLPVPDAAETNADGSVVYVDFSKDVTGTSVSGWKVNTFADDEDASATQISVSKITISGKRVALQLESEIAEPVITVTYGGTAIASKDDGSKAEKFSDFPVENKITSMEPYSIARYTDGIASKVYVQWNKPISSTAAASEFTVFVDGADKGHPSSVAVSADAEDVLELSFESAITNSGDSEITLSYAGGSVTSTTGTKTAKSFTKSSVQNFYLKVSCFDLLNAATEKNIGFAGGWDGAGSFVKTTYGGIPVYSWTNKGAAYANLQTYSSDADQRMSPEDLAEFQNMTSKSGLRLKGRIYVAKDETAGGLQLQLNDMGDYGSNYGVIDLSGILKTGEWVEFDENFSDHTVNYQTYNPSFTFTGVKIRPLTDADNGAKVNYEIYIDYLQLCPPNPSVKATSGKVSFDGKQVEIKFSFGMRVPIVNEYASSPITIFVDGDEYEVESIETKVGDATSLILNMKEPIPSGTNVTATYYSYTEEVVSIDGRGCEDIDEYNLDIANLVDMTVATGWHDHFDDASDYTTWEIGGDGKIVTAGKDTESPSQSVLEVTQKETESWAGALTISCASANYVMDLSGREKIAFKVSTKSGTMNGYYRIDIIDYFGNLSEGDWTAVSIPTSGKEIEYTSANFEIIDRTAVDQVLFRFVSDKGDASNDYTPTFYGGTLLFDYITVGDPLTLKVTPAKALNQAQGVDENSTIVGTSSANGHIYVVPFETTPQFSALEAAVADKLGVKVACSKDVATDVSLDGIGYGFFYAYSYDPDAGALSPKVPITINDVTPPTILDCYDGDVTSDGSVYVTSSENGTVYVVESSQTGLTYNEIVDVRYYSLGCSGGETVTILVNDILGEFKIGDELAFYVLDDSYNLSAMSTCKFTIKPEALKINNVYIDEDEHYEPIGPISSATSKDIVKVLASRIFSAAYLVTGNTSVTAETIESVAALKVETTTMVAELDLSEMTISGDMAGHIYISDGTTLVGPYDIDITMGTVYLTSLDTEVEEVSVNVGETVKVKVIEDPLNASTKTLSVEDAAYATFEYEYDSEKGDNYINVTGVASTAGVAKDMVIKGTGENDEEITKTIKLTVVQLPTEITVAAEAGKTASMSIGEKQTLVATVAPDDADVKTVTWSSSDATKVSVNATTGEVEAKAITTEPVTITATSTADKTITGTIEISVAAVQVSAITTTESKTVEVPMNSTATRIITVEPSDATNKDLNVASGSESVATATYKDGTLTISGVGVGETTITLTPKDEGDAELVFNVTVTCPTTAPTASDIELVQSFCEGTVNTLAITGSWTPVWYEAATGGAALAATPGTTETTEAGNYTYYVAKTADGCESAGRLEVTMSVKAKPQASLNNTELEFCATTESVELKATGSDNTWSVTKGGSDVTATAISEGKFLPKTAGAGEYEITVTRGTEGCSTTDSKTFTVTAAPAVTLTLPTGLCTGSEPAALSASVDGGTWSGTGVEGATFNPSKGEAIVTYTYTEGACTVVEEGTIKVGTTPSPKISGLDEMYCSNAAEVAMTAAPEGGAFTVNDAAATSFNPATATVGDNTVSYTVTVDGCEGTVSATVKVVAAPSIDLSGVQTTACANEVVALAPETGKWSGTGVDGVTFKSATADTYELTYTETTADGCSASETVSIAVSKPTAPKASSATVALGDAVPALTAEGTGTITWYDSETATEGTEGATYTPSVSTEAENTYTFYVTNTDGECESEKVAVALVVSGCAVAAPSINEVDAICDGDEFPELTATGSESTFTWYDAITEGTKLGEGATFTPTAAGTYYASQSSDECEGPRASVVVVVKEKPAVPTATGASSCSGAALVAMTTLESANWYASKEDAALATASKSYKPEAITETTTFFVNQTVAGCTSDFAEVVYTVKATPESPVAEPVKACLGDAEFAVTAEGSNLQWYDANNSPLGTDAKQAVSGVTTAKDYSYTVTQTVDGCESAPATATLTVNALPKVEITVADEQCSSSEAEVALTANVGIAVGEGVFKIAGAAKTSFVPSSYNVDDVLAITYEFTETETGCVGTATKNVTIIDCSDDPVASIEVLPAKVSLTEIGQTQQLDITIKYDGVEGQYNSAIACESSDESVAKVDQNGKITAVSTGTATITVASTYTIGKSATCEVSVIIPVKEASFTESSITLASGQSKDITELLTYTEGAVVTLEWTAGAGLTVVDGVVTAEATTEAKSSTVKVKVSTADGSYKEATVAVNIEAEAKLVESITFVEGATLTLQENSTYKMNTPAVSQATDMSFTWSIEGTGATIDAEGNISVTGKSGDSFKVVATANDEGKVKAECVVTICDQIIPVESLAFSEEATYEIYASESIDMSKLLIINPENATVNSVVWSVANTNYGTISEDGIFTGNAETINAAGITRQASITATVTDANNKTMKKQQTVRVVPDPIYVTSITIPEKLSIEVGGSYTFKNADVTVLPMNAGSKEYTWSIKTEGANATISEEGVITVNENAEVGETFVVVATANDIKAVESNECEVTILQQTVKITDIKIDVEEISLDAGTSKNFYITLLPEGTTQTNVSVTTTDTEILELMDQGEGAWTVRALAGTTGSVITVKSLDNPALVRTINVVAVEKVKSLKIKGAQQVTVGNTVNLTVEITEPTATDKTVTWLSSNPDVATVSQNGIVLGKNPGVVQITATANDGSNVSNFIDISVDKIPVEEISAKDIELELGQSVVIETVIKPANASYKNLEYNVADPSIINVDADGIITTLAMGQTTVDIIAVADGIDKTITVTVTAVRADKEALYQLINNETYGAYSVYYKVLDNTIMIGWGKGQISPLVYNEFQNAWMDAQTVYYKEFATQDEVDAAARRLNNAIRAMGQTPDIEIPDAVEDVTESVVAVYPTIVSDVVTIEGANLKSVKIVSATGKVVAQETVAGDMIEINAASFAQGNYKVIVETANGVEVKSFIKK